MPDLQLSEHQHLHFVSLQGRRFFPHFPDGEGPLNYRSDAQGCPAYVWPRCLRVGGERSVGAEPELAGACSQSLHPCGQQHRKVWPDHKGDQFGERKWSSCLLLRTGYRKLSSSKWGWLSWVVVTPAVPRWQPGFQRSRLFPCLLISVRTSQFFATWTSSSCGIQLPVEWGFEREFEEAALPL